MRYTILLHYPKMTPEDLGDGGWDEGQREFHAYATALDQAGAVAHHRPGPPGVPGGSRTRDRVSSVAAVTHRGPVPAPPIPPKPTTFLPGDNTWRS